MGVMQHNSAGRERAFRQAWRSGHQTHEPGHYGMIRGVLEGQYQAGIGYLPNGYSELEARELKKRSQREMGHLAQTRDLLVKQRSALKTKTTTCSRQRTSAQLMPPRGKAVRSRSIRSDSSAMDSGIYCNST